ncbi:hypothetical protein GIB67_029751, partial [Kingdonia uniflora]
MDTSKAATTDWVESGKLYKVCWGQCCSSNATITLIGRALIQTKCVKSSLQEFRCETDEYLPVKFFLAARDGSLSCAFSAGANTLISKLTQEKKSVIQQSNKLREELLRSSLPNYIYLNLLLSAMHTVEAWSLNAQWTVSKPAICKWLKPPANYYALNTDGSLGSTERLHWTILAKKDQTAVIFSDPMQADHLQTQVYTKDLIPAKAFLHQFQISLRGYFLRNVDIQALAHVVKLTRQGVVDSLEFSKGNLFQAFQVHFQLFVDVLLLPLVKNRFEGLLKIDSLKEIKTPLIIDDVSKKNTDNSTPRSSQMTTSSSNRMEEDGSSPTQVSSGDVICDDTAILSNEIITVVIFMQNGVQEKSMAAVDKISDIVENLPHK